MQTKKMSLANIQGKLSRAEMKKIMAGSGCSTSGCTLYDASTGITYTGYCGFTTGPGAPFCECKTSYGFYLPNGASHCST